MKKNLFVLLLMAKLACSQNVNNTPLNEIDVEYIEIKKTTSWGGGKINIEVDYGQEVRTLIEREKKLKDNNRTMEFNSIVNALNLLYKNGYELFQVYVENTAIQSCSHYLLKKREIILLK
jgi:ribonuclease HI